MQTDHSRKPDGVVALLKAMVRTHSINAALPGGEGTASLCALLESVAGTLGLRCRRLPMPTGENQLLVWHEPRPGGPWLLFDSHMDTVAVDGMSIDPFGGELRDGKVWGRGSCDTKGTGAAMLWALHDFATSQSTANNVAVLFSVDEEVAMTGIQHFVSHDLPTLGWDLVGVVVGEPSEHQPVVAHHGCVRWKVTTTGKACHSATPHEGRSAISAMVRVVDAIESRYIPSLTAEHKLTGGAVCSVNTFHGGDAPNIVPAICTIEIDRRLAPGEDGKTALKNLEAVLRPLRKGEPTVDYEIVTELTHPPFGTAHNKAWSERVCGVLSKRGLPTVLHGAPFATHACYFDAAGVPAVVLGPGASHKAHTKDEWIAVDQVTLGVQVYLDLMRSEI